MSAQADEVYLDGQWLARDQATVSVFDRGFIFGDGVYELIPAYGRRPFLAAEHIDRLQRSLGELSIPNPHSKQQWLELVGQAAQRADSADQRIYLQVTRGAAPRLHRFPAETVPTVLMFADPLVLPDQTAVQAGVAAVTTQDFRWLRGDIKSISLAAAVLASEHAAVAGAAETIFIRDGRLSEGASTNVLVGIDGALHSPQIDRRILSGVTLALLDRLASEAGTSISYRDISEAELRGADEVMICSSGREVLAVTELDGEKIGSGQPGQLFARLHAGYRAAAQAG